MRRNFSILFTFILTIAGALTNAKTAPAEAPFCQFKLPIFGEDGYKKWDLYGQEGQFNGTDQRVDIKGMRLRVFNDSNVQSLTATLESPSATVFPKLRRAEGKEFVFLTTSHYTIVGHGWLWEECAHDSPSPYYRIILQSDVRVVFKESKEKSLPE